MSHPKLSLVVAYDALSSPRLKLRCQRSVSKPQVSFNASGILVLSNNRITPDLNTPRIHSRRDVIVPHISTPFPTKIAVEFSSTRRYLNRALLSKLQRESIIYLRLGGNVFGISGGLCRNRTKCGQLHWAIKVLGERHVVKL
jgi:hypothetical protein